MLRYNFPENIKEMWEAVLKDSFSFWYPFFRKTYIISVKKGCDYMFAQNKNYEFFFFLLLTLFFIFPTHSFANASWHDFMQATYGKENNSQYTNASVSFLKLKNPTILFDFRLMEGSENRDKAYASNVAGIMIPNSSTSGAATIVVDGKKVELNFLLKDNVVTVSQKGTLPINASGQYVFTSKDFRSSDKSIIALIESLPPSLTSLNVYNRPYRLEVIDKLTSTGDYEVKAIHEPSKKVFALFTVHPDLHSVYREDGGKKEIY